MSHRCDVVIATRDRPAALSRCLHSLVPQSEQDFGVIVVDDCSGEALDDVVAAPGLQSLDISVHRMPEPSGPAAARNAGVNASDATFIIFLDDDIRAHWRLIETHLSASRPATDSAGPVVSCGPFLEPPDWSPNAWNKWETLQTMSEADDLTNGVYDITWRQFHTGNNCLPRAAFHEAGGFDAAFKRAEDDEFALRLAGLGCTFRWEPAALAWHYPQRSLQRWLEIPASYAVHDAMIDARHPHMHYLETKKAELHDRHPALRASRSVLLRSGLADVGIRGWVALGRVLYRVGALRPSMAALSAAYDLIYVDALSRHEAGRPRSATTSSGSR